jgi:hypothetical protein
MIKKPQIAKLQSIMNRLSRNFRPDEILHELSVVYEEYAIVSPTEAEAAFWLKCGRATGNLASGMDKWLDEMVEEQEEEEEEEEEEG